MITKSISGRDSRHASGPVIIHNALHDRQLKTIHPRRLINSLYLCQWSQVVMADRGSWTARGRDELGLVRANKQTAAPKKDGAHGGRTRYNSTTRPDSGVRQGCLGDLAAQSPCSGIVLWDSKGTRVVNAWLTRHMSGNEASCHLRVPTAKQVGRSPGFLTRCLVRFLPYCACSACSPAASLKRPS